MNVVVREVVLNTLRASECLTIGEIAETTGRSVSAVRAAVKALVESGQVVPLGEAFHGGRTYSTADYAAQIEKTWWEGKP